MGFEKFGILGAAAALAACSPGEKVPDNTGLDRPEAASVMKADGDTIEITLPEESVVEPTPENYPQYTQEQIDRILSGETQEVDGMTSEEIAKLGGPE